MTEQERQANRELRALDEAHRLGRISRDDYRARRRRLLGALCDSNGVTARNAITPSPGAARWAGNERDTSADALQVLFPARGGQARKYLVALAVVVVLCALALYALLRGD